jgi:hypothetical protein
VHFEVRRSAMRLPRREEGGTPQMEMPRASFE